MSALIRQKHQQVLIRDPAVGRYGQPVDASPWAVLHWPYAAMSENVYRLSKARHHPPAEPPTQPGQTFPSPEAVAAACADADRKTLLPVPGWTRWSDFPDARLAKRIDGQGLFFVVYERVAEPWTIAIAFEGTNFGQLGDWRANFRWLARFRPNYEDQYTLAASEVSAAFRKRITDPAGRYRVDPANRRLLSDTGEPIRLVTTGDSLGGGLAQQFAYALQQVPEQPNGPRIDEVYVFNPSPVTGWFSTPDPPRSYNAKGLVIHRIFEHGEILAYLRLLTSRPAVTAQNPAIWEYRYNFARSTPVRNHSIRRLTCGLLAAATRTPAG